MKKKIAKALKIGEFVPTMQPSYATFDEVMEAQSGITYADLKYDGYRTQIHKTKRGFKVFTRNGNELNYDCYPEIVKIVEKLPNCIIEAELVGEGINHKQVFDNVKKRFRRPGISQKSFDKYMNSGLIDSIPLSLRVFETLRFEKKTLIYTPLRDRRKYTEKFDMKNLQPAETEVATSVDELEAIINASFRNKQEGRVCKNPSSLYIPGGQTLDWVKFKRSEPLDLVVVGFYDEGYIEDLPFTSVLCATYNDETNKYETIGKIGAVRNKLANLIYKEVKDSIVDSKSEKVVFSEKLDKPIYSKFVPTSYIDPDKSVVLEVNALNLNYSNNWQTCGLKDDKAFSMRIGFAKQLRYDKNPRQATKTSAVRKLYELSR